MSEVEAIVYDTDLSLTASPSIRVVNCVSSVGGGDKYKVILLLPTFYKIPSIKNYVEYYRALGWKIENWLLFAIS